MTVSPPSSFPLHPAPPSAMHLGASTTFYAVSPPLHPAAALVCLLPIFPAEALGPPYPMFGTSSPHTSLLCLNPAPPLWPPTPQVPRELRAGAGAVCQLCETGGQGRRQGPAGVCRAGFFVGPFLLLGGPQQGAPVLGGSPSPRREPPEVLCPRRAPLNSGSFVPYQPAQPLG